MTREEHLLDVMVEIEGETLATGLPEEAQCLHMAGLMVQRIAEADQGTAARVWVEDVKRRARILGIEVPA